MCSVSPFSNLTFFLFYFVGNKSPVSWNSQTLSKQQFCRKTPNTWQSQASSHRGGRRTKHSPLLCPASDVPALRGVLPSQRLPRESRGGYTSCVLTEEDKYEQEQKGIEAESLKRFWDFLARARNNLSSSRAVLLRLMLIPAAQKKGGISEQDSDADWSSWEHKTQSGSDHLKSIARVHPASRSTVLLCLQGQGALGRKPLVSPTSVTVPASAPLAPGTAGAAGWNLTVNKALLARVQRLEPTSSDVSVRSNARHCLSFRTVGGGVLSLISLQILCRYFILAYPVMQFLLKQDLARKAPDL